MHDQCTSYPDKGTAVHPNRFLRLFLLFTLSTLSLVSATALGAGTGRWFVSLNAGRGYQPAINSNSTQVATGFLNQFNTGLLSSYNVSSSSTAAGYGADFGYRFNRLIAVQLGYLDFGNASGNFQYAAATGAKGGGDFSLKTRGITLAADSQFRFTQHFYAYGTLGVIYARTQLDTSCTGLTAICTGLASDNTHNNLAPMFAVGLGYRFSDGLNAGFGYKWFYHLGNQSTGGRDNPHYAYVGIGYSF